MEGDFDMLTHLLPSNITETHSGMRPERLQLENSSVIWFTLFLVTLLLMWDQILPTICFYHGCCLFIYLFFSYIVVGGFTLYLNFTLDFSPLPQEFACIEM